MKKEPGVNGDWIPVSLHERVHHAALPSIVALGTPAIVQTQYAFSDGWGDRGWVLPAAIWLYGLLFWIMSTGRQLVRSKRWEWTEAALDEQQRYLTEGRKASRRFWGFWWVRFPIGLLFLSYGVHLLGSTDFSVQWLSLILLMSAFVTPFVFVAELALLPLVIVLMFAYLAVVVSVPLSVIIMLGCLGLVATVLMAIAQRAPRPPKPAKEVGKEAAVQATPADETASDPPATPEQAQPGDAAGAEPAPAAASAEAADSGQPVPQLPAPDTAGLPPLQPTAAPVPAERAQ
jgi:hypothetical protein